MPKRKLLPAVAGLAALAVGAFVAAPPARATIIHQGPGSPITITDIHGLGKITFTPSPASDILDVTGSDYTNDFLPQDPTTVGNGIATVFGQTAPTLTANNESPGSSFTESPTGGFNFVAIHNDSGELVFYYTSLQTTFTFSNSAGAVSNARFYTCEANTPGCNVPPSVPEPAALLLLGSGLLGLGAVVRRRSRRA